MRIPAPYTWATSISTYSAPTKPWNGTPIIANPGIDFYTPQAGATAQGMNYNLSRVTKDIASLNDSVGQLSAVNWGVGLYPTTGFTGSACTPMENAPTYDVKWGRWVWCIDAGVSVTPRYQVYESPDGQNWTLLGGGSSLTRAGDSIASLPDGTICILENGAFNADVIVPGNTVWGAHSLNPSGPNTAGQTAICAFGSRFVAAYGLVSGTAPTLKYSADGVTWTSCTGTFTALTSSAGGFFACSPTLAVFLPADVSSKLYTSTDGITWTAHTTSVALYGITYDDVSGYFYALTTTGIYKSTDGIGWTFCSTFVTSSVSNIVAGGGMVLISVHGYHNSKDRVLCSTDGCVTWRFTRLGGTSSDSPRMGYGAGQFVYTDASYYAASTATGLPPVATLP